MSVAPAITINFEAPVSGATGTIAVGDVLVPVSGLYVKATTANRASAAAKCHGVALTAWNASQTGSVRIQAVGTIDAATSNLGSGTASPLRVSSTGVLERVTTPSSSDEVVGYCDADGTAHLLFGGVLTHRVFVDSVGSSSTGQVLYNSSGAVAGSSLFIIDTTTGAITAAPASGTPSYAFGALSTVGANLGAFCGGYSNTASNNWCVALGSFNNASAAGAFCIGELLTASAANAGALGYSANATGTYSYAIGTSITAGADYSFCTGVLAATRQAGERSHGYNLTGIQPEKVWGGGGTGAGVAVNLIGAGGAEFVAAQGSFHELFIELWGIASGGGTDGRAVYRATAIYPSGGGLTVKNVTRDDTMTTGAFFSGAWGVTIAASGANVRININPGVATVKFGCRVTWGEMTIP